MSWYLKNKWLQFILPFSLSLSLSRKLCHLLHSPSLVQILQRTLTVPLVNSLMHLDSVVSEHTNYDNIFLFGKIQSS